MRFLSVIALLVLISCGSRKDSVSRLWFFTHTNGTVRGSDTSLSPVSFLQLRKDGTYTLDFGRFEHGTWDLEEDQLFLKNQQGKTNSLGFQFDGKEMQIKIGNNATANFESKPLPKASADPFSKENNQWRIPPAKKETDSEIRQRLLNHCRFWEAYFTWALDNKLTTVDVRSTPTLIKIYGNGFGLKPFEELPAAWISYFYDEEDARRANNQMAYVFNDKDIAWGNSDNKFKMFLSAFQQLSRHLE